MQGDDAPPPPIGLKSEEEVMRVFRAQKQRLAKNGGHGSEKRTRFLTTTGAGVINASATAESIGFSFYFQFLKDCVDFFNYQIFDPLSLFGYLMEN
jgi:hypothetical protein